MLNKKQTVVLSLGLFIIAAMSLFPPWSHTASWGSLRTPKHMTQGGSIGEIVFSSTRPGEYAFLLHPPEEPNRPRIGIGSGTILDIPRLSLQYVIVAALTAIGVVATKTHYNAKN